MLTGNLPFDGSTIADINEKIRIGRFDMPKNISKEAQNLLRRMIDYNNDERASFGEVVKHPWFTQPSNVKI